MLTTCPECRTVFRVGQEQLDDKRGLVRCGHCRAVFNAYDTLLPELASLPQADAASEAPEAAAAPPDLAMFTDDMLAMPPAVTPGRPFEAPPLSVPSVPDEAPGETLAERRETLPEAREAEFPAAEGDRSPATMAFQPAAARLAQDIPAQTVAEPPGLLPAPEPDDILLTPLVATRPTARAAWLPGVAWGGAALILVLLLFLQLSYFLRDELAAAVPGLRPTLQRACAQLGCSLLPARDLTALRIEASSLESDTEDKSRASLNLSLSNRSDRAVAWPHLVLVLTDTRDLPVAQRPFAPAEYLPAEAVARPGLEPGREQEARLELELKGLAAYGYKLELAYP